MCKLWKKVSRMKKMASRKIFRQFLNLMFFLFILLISNHSVFLYNLAFVSFSKSSLIPNWTRDHMITYTTRDRNLQRIFLIAQFRYIKVQSKTIDLNTRLRGTTREFVSFFPRSEVYCSEVYCFKFSSVYLFAIEKYMKRSKKNLTI